MTIRVIEAQVLRTQNLNRDRYEVVSTDSPFYEHVSEIAAEIASVIRDS